MINMIKVKIFFVFAVILLCSGCSKNESVESANPDSTPGVESSAEVSSEATESAKPTESARPPVITDVPVEYEEDKQEAALLPYDKIAVARWDDISYDFCIDAKLYYAKNYFDHSYSCDYEILPEDNFDKICERNQEYLIENGTYKDEYGNTYDAAYYFCNNNAYVLYEYEDIVDYEGTEKVTAVKISLINRMIWDETDCTENNYIVKAPFPVGMTISYFDIRSHWENEKNKESWAEKYLFSCCTFEEAKDFYDMFSEGTAVIDEDNKVIKVKGTACSDESNKKKIVWAVFDFKQNTYEVQNADGSLFHSVDTCIEEIKAGYSSAGIIDGKEVIYDIGSYIYVMENGKRRAILDEEGMSEFLESMSGYNCVGEECILKLKKIKGDKYYFDVTATFDDDGVWTKEYSLVVENMKGRLKF